MRTRSTDDDNAILEDLEIGEYQDMEMNEMYGINESSRGDETREKKTKKVNVDVNDFGEEEEDKGGGRDGPLIQNPTSMTNVALQITKSPFNYKVEDLFLTVENHRRLQPKDRIRFPSKNLPAGASTEEGIPTRITIRR